VKIVHILAFLVNTALASSLPNVDRSDFRNYVAEEVGVDPAKLVGSLWLSKTSREGHCVTPETPRLIPFQDNNQSPSLKNFAYAPNCGAQAIMYGKAKYDFYVDQKYAGRGAPSWTKVSTSQCISCHKNGSLLAASKDTWHLMNEEDEVFGDPRNIKLIKKILVTQKSILGSLLKTYRGKVFFLRLRMQTAFLRSEKFVVKFVDHRVNAKEIYSHLVLRTDQFLHILKFPRCQPFYSRGRANLILVWRQAYLLRSPLLLNLIGLMMDLTRAINIQIGPSTTRQ
jgi:hypothetical protein